MRTKATPSESTTPWERPKQWAMDWTIPDDWSQNVMDHCALRAARPSVFEPCWQVLAAERSVQRRFGGNWRLPSVVGGTRKHEWVAGDKVRIAIGGGAHTTGVVVALPDPVAGRGWWKVRRDGEKKIRSARKNALGALPRPLRHLWDASVTYNDRWFESRAELYALLMGRQRRLGKGSVCKWIAGNHIVWRRIAEYALAPVSYLHLDEGGTQGNVSYWNESPVHLHPDPRRGVVARAYVLDTPGFSAVGVSRLRVLRFDWLSDDPDNPPLYSKAVAHKLLGLVAEHCRDLRALRIDGLSAEDDTSSTDADREPITRVLERCLELRILYVHDCVDFMPIPTPGRQYALTHIYTGMFDEENHQSPATFSAWVDAAPNLRHYGCKHCFCESEGMGIDFLEAAANATNLETLDLFGWLAHDDETSDAARLQRVMSALPQNLRIAPHEEYDPGDPMFDNAIGDALREAARAAGRGDLQILRFSTSPDAHLSSTRRPLLWDWFEAAKTLCYA